MKKKPKPKTSKKTFQKKFTKGQLEMIRRIVREEYYGILQTASVAAWYTSGNDGVPVDVREETVEGALAKIEAGIDLTPLGFGLPPKASYFSKDDDGNEVQAGFTERYLEFLQAGDSSDDAYIKTCGTFGLPDFQRGT